MILLITIRGAYNACSCLNLLFEPSFIAVVLDKLINNPCSRVQSATACASELACKTASGS